MTAPDDTESLFAAWLARREDGETIPIDSFAAEHPSHADGLRRMHDDWRRMMKAQRGSGLETSLADRLRERFGSGVDPEVSLDGDATKAMDDATYDAAGDSRSSLYQDLKSRGPSSGRYRLDGELAQGGMGAILRVYDKDLRRTLAMKVMLEEKQGRLSRFLEEAQVTGQLDHPGIVPVHELGIDARGKVFFTMKLVKGKDLREVFDMVKTGAEGWTVTRALTMLQRVCEAMAFAHEKNVIHRDLKPGNVMVGRHGEVYVMDWGLARVLGKKDTKDVRVAPASQSFVNTERRESSASRNLNGEADADTPDAPLLTMDGDAIGTPSYMPLEQAEGNLDAIGPRSDVYAVGAMLYHLLAGHPPYVDGDERVAPLVIIDRVKRGAPEPIRTLARDAPIELIAICEKAMARKFAQRYATMAELGDDLRAYLERRVVKAYRTGVVAETRMWIARNRALAAAIAVIFVLLAGFAWQQRGTATRAERTLRLLQPSELKDLRDAHARGKALLEDRGAVYRSYSGYETLIASMKQWSTDAESTATRLPAHEATLASIEARGRRSEKDASIEFDSKEDAWWHSAVAELVTGFRSLTLNDPNATSVRAMRDRIAEFETIYAHSVGEHRTEWDACIASIADPAQCPQYNGLKIVPQVGLLPIGRDPQSGMWEFWFVDVTGVKPERGEDRKLVLTDDFGLVFVLLPGGTFWMGAQSEDPNRPNFDSNASSDEGPVHEVSLAPFFLSKYEMTQHQSILAPGNVWSFHFRDSRLPADFISWDDARAVLPILHLDLPTEAQWEYACRAGTSTPWSTGSEKASLLGFANLNDGDLKDEIDNIAVVGSLLPNAFGLHDMHGNLWEWCRDGYAGKGDYEKTFDPATGEHASDRPGIRAGRGGGSHHVAAIARSANRSGFDAGMRFVKSGVRPRRDVMGD